MSRRGLDCRIHLPQFPGVKCPVPCNRYTAMLALTLPSVEVLIVCVVDSSRCVMVCDMAAKKVPAKKVPAKKEPTPAKKKTASAADFRKADQASMAKYKSGVGRTDAKGNKGFGGKTVYPKSYPEAFWDSPGGKVIRRTNPIMVLGDTLSSFENFMSKRTKKKGPGEW